MSEINNNLTTYQGESDVSGSVLGRIAEGKITVEELQDLNAQQILGDKIYHKLRKLIKDGRPYFSPEVNDIAREVLGDSGVWTRVIEPRLENGEFGGIRVGMTTERSGHIGKRETLLQYGIAVQPSKPGPVDIIYFGTHSVTPIYPGARHTSSADRINPLVPGITYADFAVVKALAIAANAYSPTPSQPLHKAA